MKLGLCQDQDIESLPEGTTKKSVNNEKDYSLNDFYLMVFMQPLVALCHCL
jgi:hypothetical protein